MEDHSKKRIAKRKKLDKEIRDLYESNLIDKELASVCCERLEKILPPPPEEAPLDQFLGTSTAYMIDIPLEDRKLWSSTPMEAFEKEGYTDKELEKIREFSDFIERKKAR